MSFQNFRDRVAVVPFAFFLALPLAAQEAPAPAPTIAEALDAASPEVRKYNDHIVTLASPFMEGRIPGSRGMEIAKEYIEHYLRKAGLEPGFPVDGGAAGEKTWRDPFPLSATLELVSEHLSVAGGKTYRAEKDFHAMSYGAGGEAKGELVFVGYSIRRGPDGYETFADDDDLTGKIALVLRFEPMDEEGKSKWSKRGRWTGRGGFATKLRALEKRNPAGVIIVNTPGADDPRVNELVPLRDSRARLEVPVINMMGDAAAEMVAAIAPDGPTLMELRRMADEGGGITSLGGQVDLRVDMERKPLIAENTGGLLPGRGDLANEYIVVGAHLDHLGMGEFGSRSGPGKLHPGADDNASGSAAVIMLAERLAATYEDLPADANARAILFVCFSAEESGLNGARHLAGYPIIPDQNPVLMINFDMIGRIVDKRLVVSGTDSAVGLKEWIQPFLDDTPLEIVSGSMGGGSDHSAFASKQIPYLFSIIADFHGDYHTPRDVSEKINRVDAVHTIDLYEKILFAAATRPETFEWKGRERRSRRPVEVTVEAAAEEPTPVPSKINVRFGISMGRGDGSTPGVPVAGVSEGSPAAQAGVQDGDRITKWNGKDVDGVRSWMQMLGTHKPGDEVEVTVARGTKEVVLKAKLVAAD